MRKIGILLLLLLIFINVLYVISGALHFSLRSVDVYAIWLFKAKAFYITDGLPLKILNDNRYLYSHPNYPLLLPYIFSLIYKVVGGAKEIYIFLLYPFVYTSILLIVYKLLRKLKIGVLLALIFVYSYSMSGPFLAQGGRYHAGTADIFLVLLNWIIIYFAYLYHKKSNNKYLLFIVLLTAVASQIKAEGVFISTVLLFLPVKRSKKIILFTLSLIPTLIWLSLIKRWGMPSDLTYFIPSVYEIISRSFDILKYVAIEMLNYKNWYIFWPLFFISLFITKNTSAFFKNTIYPSTIIISLTFFSVYLFTKEVTPIEYVPASIDRILFQLSPLFCLIFTLSIPSLFISHHKVSRHLYPGDKELENNKQRKLVF